MTPIQISANPFALMTNPEAVFAALAGSDRLQRLSSRMCRPLDKALGPRPSEGEAAVADAVIDLEPAEAERLDSTD